MLDIFLLDFTPFLISFKLAGITTLVLFCISLPIAWYLSNSSSRIKPAIEAIIALPIVLPPSVIGFYILWIFSYDSLFGQFFRDIFGIQLAFTFFGLVVASCFYSLPFMVQPLQSGFESINKNIIDASYISGKGKIETIFKVILPSMKPSLLTAIVITFAHTVGEFGVVLMIGGSIPGETKVASVAIYELVEVMDYKLAHIYSFIMIIVSFFILFIVYVLNQTYLKHI